MKDIAILIPAYNPDAMLENVVNGLRQRGFNTIILVNDGSTPDKRELFERLSAHCELVEHAANLGKGRALKTGFNHIAVHHADLLGVVTVDADGQHHPDDVLELAQKLKTSDAESIIIGQRAFESNVPLRSKIGNVLTRYVFYFLAGRFLLDTQSGLRGVRMESLPELLCLPGEAYDYEMNMLVHTRTMNLKISTIPIRTIYIEDNKSSHFNPFFDSLKIYFVFIRFISSSLISSLLDLAVYTGFIFWGAGIGVSLLIARALSSYINFILNKNYVFLKKSEFISCLAKYYALVVVIFTLSYILVSSMYEYLGINAIVAKVISETLLFVFSFLVQRALVFVKR